MWRRCSTRRAGVLACVLLGWLPVPVAAQPCVADDCTEWLSLGQHDGRALVYRTLPLDQPAPAVTHAVVVVHGASAGAAGHFRVGIDAARRAGALANTLIIAPRIPSSDNYACNDSLEPGEVNWGCQANNGWPAGGTARGDDTLTSYDLMDEILTKLAVRTMFPNLRSIFVAGHSAGGQYVVRYAMANRVHDRLGVPVTYVVSNPAHYAYPDAGRLDAGGRVVGPAESRDGCKIYDVWPYGLQDRRGYTLRLSDEELRAQLASRDVVYLLGEQDTLTGRGLDTACAARAQGLNRLERGRTFAEHMHRTYAAGHRVVVVPMCGHSAGCMFTSDAARPWLFPNRATAAVPR